MRKFLIRTIETSDIKKRLEYIGFDSVYLEKASLKYDFLTLQISNLSCPQATILKQTALSLGTDAAVHRDVLIQNVSKTDVIVGGSYSQLKQIANKLLSQPFSLKILGEGILSHISRVKSSLNLRNKVFDGSISYVMGILNVTPDSFSDGGKCFDLDSAYAHYEKLLTDGADIIDIGGESTRPNHTPVSCEEEIKRVLPLIKKIRENDSETILSIDTRHAQTAEICLNEGVDIINDIGGLEDEKMFNVIEKYKPAVVVCESGSYEQGNIVKNVLDGLIEKANKLENIGLEPSKIILDVGIGFNKTFDENFELIKNAKDFTSLPYRSLFGVSRKSFIREVLGVEALDTESANIAIASYLAIKNVDFIRVHDVLSHKRAFKVLEKLL